jgi:hypothetical protein
MADATGDAPAEKPEATPRCKVSPEMMKLVTLITLLASDFDMVMTLITLFSFFQYGGMYVMAGGLLCVFFLMYVAGCTYAAMESTKFVIRFTDKVKLNEINGISLEDLNDALNGKRIFWMGCANVPARAVLGGFFARSCRVVYVCACVRSPIYEKGKKRKIAIEALKALTPDAVDPSEINIEQLEQALKDAQAVGADQLRMPGDNVFGARSVKKAVAKLKQAKEVRKGNSPPPITDADLYVPDEGFFDPKLKQIADEHKAALDEGEDARNRARMLELAMLDQVRRAPRHPPMHPLFHRPCHVVQPRVLRSDAVERRAVIFGSSTRSRRTRSCSTTAARSPTRHGVSSCFVKRRA